MHGKKEYLQPMIQNGSVRTHDTILVFSKNKAEWHPCRLVRNEEQNELLSKTQITIQEDHGIPLHIHATRAKTKDRICIIQYKS